MTFELSTDEAALVREFVEGRLVEMRKEINRTESVAFRAELRKVAGALDRLVAQLSRTVSA